MYFADSGPSNTRTVMEIAVEEVFGRSADELAIIGN
jgi:hypothetical protein